MKLLSSGCMRACCWPPHWRCSPSLVRTPTGTAAGQLLMLCSRVPRPGQRCWEVTLSPHVFSGAGSSLHCELDGSAFQMSFLVSFLSSTPPHLTDAACYHMLTILLLLTSPTPALASSRRHWCLLGQIIPWLRDGPQPCSVPDRDSASFF